MQAIVLAGGLGTRLRSVVPELPKPMAPVAGRPFLAWLLDALAAGGVRRVVLAVGYRHDAIRNHFGGAWRGMALDYSIEPAPLGTGGAIRLAAERCDASAPSIVLNGDTFLQVDLLAMHAQHVAASERLTVAACHVDDVSRYGALRVEQGHIAGFLEKGHTGPGFINAGTYVLAPETLLALPSGEAFSFEQRVLMGALDTLKPAAFETPGAFIDIGIPEDFARAQTLLPQLTATPAR